MIFILSISIFFTLSFQRQRISASDALNHPFLEEARLRYHSCMCTCCFDITPGSTNELNQTNGGYSYTSSPSNSSCASSTPSFDSLQGNNGKLLNRFDTSKTAANGIVPGGSITSTSSGSSCNGSTTNISNIAKPSIGSGLSAGTSRRRYYHDLDPSSFTLLPFDLDVGFRRLSDAKRKS